MPQRSRSATRPLGTLRRTPLPRLARRCRSRSSRTRCAARIHLTGWTGSREPRMLRQIASSQRCRRSRLRQRSRQSCAFAAAGKGCSLVSMARASARACCRRSSAASGTTSQGCAPRRTCRRVGRRVARSSSRRGFAILVSPPRRRAARTRCCRSRTAASGYSITELHAEQIRDRDAVLARVGMAAICLRRRACAAAGTRMASSASARSALSIASSRRTGI